jgi:mRNA capping enzyme, C-terminal domain
LLQLKENYPNPDPDPEAGSDDPLVTTKTRESLILKALDDFIKQGCPPVSTNFSMNDFLGEHRGAWRYFRWREDKEEPNFITVAMNTYRSIVTGVSQQDLIDVCNSIERPQDDTEGGLRKRQREEDIDRDQDIAGDER